MREIFKKDITEVIKDRTLQEELQDVGIGTIEELCSCSRMELTEKGFNNSTVKDIRIALQLNGIDLKPNHAKKNSYIVK